MHIPHPFGLGKEVGSFIIMNNKNIWGKIINIVITVLTAIATTFGVTSCIWDSDERWAVSGECGVNLFRTRITRIWRIIYISHRWHRNFTDLLEIPWMNLVLNPQTSLVFITNFLLETLVSPLLITARISNWLTVSGDKFNRTRIARIWRIII